MESRSEQKRVGIQDGSRMYQAWTHWCTFKGFPARDSFDPNEVSSVAQDFARWYHAVYMPQQETDVTAKAMRLLGIYELQTCPKCGQLWTNLNEPACRKCGTRMATAGDTSKPDNYQQRVKMELLDLSQRRVRLVEFIRNSETFRSLAPAEQARLQRQLDVMVQFETVLEERVANFPVLN